MTPTARSLAYLRGKGYQACVVEKWIPRANVRRDAFGFGDLLVCGPAIALVQVTSASNMSAREKKICGLPEAAKWRMAGGEIWLHGWSKKGKRGKRKRWTLTERRVE